MMKRHMTVADAMTSDVVAVTETASFKEIVRLLDASGIGGVPVVDTHRRPIGVVTEGDLIVKEGHPEVEPDGPLLELPAHRAERRRATASTAGELMSPAPRTIRPDATLREAARAMASARISRLLVVDENGRLTGILSRRDLLGCFLRSDEEIRDEILNQLILRELFMDPGRFVVRVEDGRVSVQGQIERRSLIPILERSIRHVEGVVSVEARLGWDWDDTELHHEVRRSGLLHTWPGRR
jgi:CBS-domain-containing membrane protein